MNILVAAEKDVKYYAMCVNPHGYTFSPPGSRDQCPYFCISQCAQKTFACHQPTVAGMSPTGVVNEQ